MSKGTNDNSEWLDALSRSVENARIYNRYVAPLPYDVEIGPRQAPIATGLDATTARRVAYQSDACVKRERNGTYSVVAHFVP